MHVEISNVVVNLSLLRAKYDILNNTYLTKSKLSSMNISLNKN